MDAAGFGCPAFMGGAPAHNPSAQVHAAFFDERDDDEPLRLEFFQES